MILLFVLACTPKSDEAFKSEAQEYIKPFKVELMSALTTGIKEKGPLEAMHSCNVLAPEIQKKLMTPFFTTKEKGKGTGIGLSLSRKMLESFKGGLRYDNSATNTTFVVILLKKNK